MSGPDVQMPRWDGAAYVRALRFQANLTQAELANILGVSLRAVSTWECAGVVPHPSTRRRLAKLAREVGVWS